MKLRETPRIRSANDYPEVCATVAAANVQTNPVVHHAAPALEIEKGVEDENTNEGSNRFIGSGRGWRGVRIDPKEQK